MLKIKKYFSFPPPPTLTLLLLLLLLPFLLLLLLWFHGPFSLAVAFLRTPRGSIPGSARFFSSPQRPDRL
jgi:hypothetical protein